MSPRTRPAVVALFCALAIGGCTRDPTILAGRRVAAGDRYVSGKRFGEAIIEYRTALTYTPRSGDTHLKLADAYLKNDDLRNAFPEYLRAADSLLDNEDAQLKAGNLLLMAGRFQEAKVRARNALKSNPKNVAALILLGNALAGLKDLDSAVEIGQQAALLEPERAGIYRNMGVFELARGDIASAERAFKHALEVDANSVSACLALAELYRISGRPDQSESILGQALRIDPRHVMANQAMASYYTHSGRPAEAEPYLKAANDQAKTIETGLALADYYIGTGRRSDAVDALHQLLTMKDGFASATTRLAAIEFAAGRRADGYALLQDVLKRNPKHVPALAVKTRLLMSEGQTEEALKTITVAITADPKEPAAQLLLGKVHLARLELEEARTAFNEALKLGSRDVAPQVELAKLHLQRGEVATAIGFVEQAIEADPDNLNAQLTMCQALIAQAEYSRARNVLKTLLLKFPTAPQVYDMAGTLALATNDRVQARRAWDHALTLDADNVDALGGISALYASEGKRREAKAFVEARLAEHPDRPGLLLLAAKVRMAEGDAAAAETALKKLIQVDPQNLQAYVYLGQMFVAQKRILDAKKEYLAVIRQRPRSVPAHTMMGLLCEAENDIPAAVEWYQKAVQIEWRAAVASNNLAWIYVTRNTNLDIALQLAEAATGAMSTQAEFFDTLGWVYYKKQLSTLAIRALKRAVDLDSLNAVHHYHLGMAYAAEGQDKIARKTLQTALKLRTDFDGADDARKVIATLLY
jgi:tetratricopeptide (TPR) repeat protein